MTKDAGDIVKNAILQSPSGATLQSITTPVATSEHPPESVKPVFERSIPNLPGKKLIAVLVSYPPAGKSRSHYHAKSAFIYAYVLAGAVRSAVGAEPARIYRAGDSFFEEPGAHHLVSENASDTEPASLLAVFVVGAGDQPLTARYAAWPVAKHNVRTCGGAEVVAAFLMLSSLAPDTRAHATIIGIEAKETRRWLPMAKLRNWVSIEVRFQNRVVSL
jgi:quercetin dioxygenase-like cupin family protein